MSTELDRLKAEIEGLIEQLEHRASMKREAKRRNRRARAERAAAERTTRRATPEQIAVLDRLATTPPGARIVYRTSSTERTDQ